MKQIALALLILTVIDGDTFIIDHERIRVMGLDAPEMKCGCARECRLAEEAKTELGRLLQSPSKLERHGKDRYGRTLAKVTVDGKDVADLMIAAGLARRYNGGRREPWC